MFVKCLIVKDLTAYNVRLGRSTLNHIKDVIVTHLMHMKFECDGGKIESLYGDQHAARECYLTTLRPSSWKGVKPYQFKIASESKATEYVKSQVEALRTVFERP